MLLYAWCWWWCFIDNRSGGPAGLGVIDNFSIRWLGYVTPPVGYSGKQVIRIIHVLSFKKLMCLFVFFAKRSRLLFIRVEGIAHYRICLIFSPFTSPKTSRYFLNLSFQFLRLAYKHLGASGWLLITPTFQVPMLNAKYLLFDELYELF